MLLHAAVGTPAMNDALATPSDGDGSDARVIDESSICGSAVDVIQWVVVAANVWGNARARRGIRGRHRVGAQVNPGIVYGIVYGNARDIRTTTANEKQREESELQHLSIVDPKWFLSNPHDRGAP
jgi:hypothetical protein